MAKDYSQVESVIKQARERFRPFKRQFATLVFLSCLVWWDNVLPCFAGPGEAGAR